MNFESELQPAYLLMRYKRFLADIKLPSDEVITIYCPNTGSMKNCQEPNSRVWYSTSSNLKRKYHQTWELIESTDNHIIGINTGLSNKLVVEAIGNETIKQLQNYSELKTEVGYGEQKSRIDILLSNGTAAQEKCYVEVKNVSLGVGAGLGLFPDAVTTRGQKHLQELMAVKKSGCRAVLLFCVQHTGIERVSPADEIDSTYGLLLREAVAAGVEAIAYRAAIDPQNSKIELQDELQVVL
jgi:sugar fermentation stimulation protein A